MALLTAGPAEHTNGEWHGPVLDAPSKSGPDPTVYLHALRRRWLMVSGIGVLLAAIAGPAVWFGMGKQYTATGYLRVSMAETPIAFKDDLTWTNVERFEIYKNTQRQLLLSRFVMISALRKPEVSAIPIIQKEQREGDPVQWLSDSLSVDFPGRAEMMTVSLTLPDPDQAQTLVSSVVDSYMSEVVNDERDRKRERYSELERVCASKEQDIRTKREVLKNLGQRYDTTDTTTLNTRQRLMLEELSLLRRQQADMQFAIQRLQGDLAAQKALLAGVDNLEIPAVELDRLAQIDPVAKQLSWELAMKQMAARYTQDLVKNNTSSPYVNRYARELQSLQQSYDEKMAELTKKARDGRRSEIGEKITEIESQVTSFQSQREALVKDIAERVKEAVKFGETTVDIEMLQADLKQQVLLSNQLASDRDKLKVELQAPARITKLGAVEKPIVPSNTLFRYALTALAIMGSFAIPGIVITFFDARAGRINCSDDVSKGLRVPVIGSVPRIPTQVIHRLSSPSKRHRSWHLRLTESVDGIAARLLHSADRTHCRVIMVSSATGGEGKTTLATQLALSLARTGRRTVLVDFDLRRPSFDEVFGVPLTPGVSELLREQNEPEDLVHESSTENLSVVTAGQWDRQALAALSNGNAAPLFKALRESFDFVVVDSSPILPVADARFVGQLVDTVVLSIFRDISQAPKIQAACDILTAFGVQSVEAVVTGLNENSYRKHLGYESTVYA